MEISEAKQLIFNAALSKEKTSIWADLGCGAGTFTLALAQLLAPGSTLYAIDKEPQLISQKDVQQVDIRFQQDDFEKDDLNLPPLDGMLMANALHYVKDKVSLLAHLQKMLKPEGGCIIVEYDTMKANPWVPYPIDFSHLQDLFHEAGFTPPELLGERKSLYNRSLIYSCFSQKA